MGGIKNTDATILNAVFDRTYVSLHISGLEISYVLYHIHAAEIKAVLFSLFHRAF